jgi:cytochrome P450
MEKEAVATRLVGPDEPVYYDPYDYEIDRNVHEVWRRLRDEAPLYWNDRYQFFALSRFEDVYHASRDSDALINGHGTVLETLAEPIKPWEEFLLLYMDPPRHTLMRKLVSRAFTPRWVSDLAADIRTITVDYLDQFVGAGSFDCVEEFAAKLPPMVIGALLGVPKADRDQLRRWFDDVMHRDEGSSVRAWSRLRLDSR